MQNRYGYTVDEIRAYVNEYLDLPHGAKGAWLAEQPFGRDTFRWWRQTYLYGDLDRGLVPRQGSGMNLRPDKKLRELEAQLARERVEHERARERLAQQTARDQERILCLEESNLALGKAIGLLQKLSAQEPDETPPTSAP